MRQIVYVSAARKRLDRCSLMEILEVSRTNNQANGLTGMLLYVDGNFIQALEGGEDHLAATLGRIEQDSRHGGMIFMVDHIVTRRTFGDWTMGFCELSRHDASAIDGLSSFLSAPSEVVKGSNLPLLLLESFKSNHLRYLVS